MPRTFKPDRFFGQTPPRPMASFMTGRAELQLLPHTVRLISIVTTQRIISILIVLSLLVSPVMPAWAGSMECGGADKSTAHGQESTEHDAHDHAGHDHGGHDHGAGHHGGGEGANAHDHAAANVRSDIPSISAQIVCCSHSPYVLAGAAGVATIPAPGQHHTLLIPTSSFLASPAFLGASPALKGLYKIGSSPPVVASDRYTYLRLSVFRI